MKKTKNRKKTEKNEKTRENPKFSVKNNKICSLSNCFGWSSVVSVQSKHRKSLFRYRSETTETNILIVPKQVSVPVSVVSNGNKFRRTPYPGLTVRRAAPTYLLSVNQDNFTLYIPFTPHAQFVHIIWRQVDSHNYDKNQPLTVTTLLVLS